MWIIYVLSASLLDFQTLDALNSLSTSWFHQQITWVYTMTFSCSTSSRRMGEFWMKKRMMMMPGFLQWLGLGIRPACRRWQRVLDVGCLILVCLVFDHAVLVDVWMLSWCCSLTWWLWHLIDYCDIGWGHVDDDIPLMWSTLIPVSLIPSLWWWQLTPGWAHVFKCYSVNLYDLVYMVNGTCSTPLINGFYHFQLHSID